MNVIKQNLRVVLWWLGAAAGLVAAPSFPVWEDAVTGGSESPVHANGTLPVGAPVEGIPRPPKSRSVQKAARALSSQGGSQIQAVTTADLSAYPADIQAIVRACESDPRKIFDLIRNHVRFQPYRGFRKRPENVWQTRSGNDADQAHLLLVCLQAAGYDPFFEYGVLFLPSADFRAWWGADTVTALNNMTGSAGYFGGYDNTQDLYGLEQIWCDVEIDGEFYRLHPAYKTYTEQTGLNLATALGYSRTGLLAAAAGTETAVSVQGVSETGVTDYLKARANILVATLRADHPNAALDEIVSGRRVIPTAIAADYADGFPAEAIIAGSFANFAFDDPYSAYDVDGQTYELAASMTIAVGLINTAGTGFTSVLAQYGAETAAFSGKKISITFNASNQAEIRLDDELVAAETTVPTGAAIGVGYSIAHRYQTNPANLYDQLRVVPAQRGGIYAYAFDTGGADAPGPARQRRLRLEALRRQGLPETSPEITTETLHLLALDWLAQHDLANRLLGAELRYVPILHHILALAKQETGFGVDIPTTQVFVARNGVTADTNVFRRAAVQIGSAMEHGVIEQNYPGRRAVSTVRYLRENNLAGGKTYRATSANYSTITADSDFQAGWSSAFRNTVFPSELTSGATLILPQSGAITLDDLTGNGYFSYTATSVSATINPGTLNGGFSTTPGLVDADANPAPFDSTFGPDSLPNPESAEPIDLYTGAYVYDRTDLALSGAGPRGLAFARSYSSLGAGRLGGALGQGWTHAYEASVVEHADYRAALGETTPVAAAALVVAAWAVGDLARLPDSPKAWVVSSIASHWALENIRTNAVTLTVGRRTLPFTKLGDGTFAPAPGITSTLVKDGGTGRYRIEERFGRRLEFDDQNRLAALVDNDGQQTTLAYAADGPDAGRLATVTDSYGRTFSFAYASDRLASVTDSTGRSLGFAYTNSLLTTVTDPAGETTTYAYDDADRILQIFNGRDELVAANTYDALGRIERQVAEGDDAQTWHYAFTGAVNTETNPDGETTAHTFDAKGRVIALTNGLGQTTRMDYDGQDHVVRLTDPRGEITRFAYDGSNNLRFTYDARNGANGTTYVRKNRYDAADQLRYVIDEDGRQTEFRYDSEFHLTTIIDPLLRETSFTYFSSGPHDGLIQTTTKPGTLAGQTLVTAFTYDANGYPDQVTRPDGSVVDSTHNARGDLTAVQILTTGDPNVHAQAFTYDLNRRLITTDDALGYGAATTYDATGDTASVTDRYGNTATFTHSPFGRRLSTTGPDNQTSLFTYDDTGRPEAVANSLNQITTTGYDDAGRAVALTDALNQTVATAYDAAGRRTALTNARNHTHAWTYTPVNLPASHTTPLGRATTTTYEARNLPATVAEPSGQTTTFTYADDARLTRTVDPVGTIDYAYDAQGRLRTVTTGAQTLTRGYDTLDRVNTFTDAAGNTIGYAYNGAGQLTTLTYPGNLAVTYAYDTAGRLSTITDWSGRVTTFIYDGQSRLSRVTFPNGTRLTMDYDFAGRVSRRLDDVTATAAVILDQAYTYDALGRIEQETIAPEPAAFTLPVTLMSYDADDRLTNWQSESLNLATASDLDGNLTTGPLGAASATFVYDARNRLTAAGSASYTYDAENRRVSKTEGGVTTTYVHDPQARLSRMLSATTGGVTTRYVYAGSTLLYEETAGAIQVYHADARGSTRAITNATGTVLGRAVYGPYGETVTSTLPATPFRYNGAYGVQTDTNGLLQMRARYYSPQTRRFLNADPIGFAGGMNFYSYANGNPVMYVDPSGYVFGTPLTYGEFFSAAGSGAAQGAIAYGKGLVVGAAVTGAVIVAAPVVASVGASALVAAGVSAGTATAVSTAAVTTTLGVASVAGAVYTGYDTVMAVNAGDGDRVAYNVGNLIGGGLVAGAGGGRYVADYVGPTRSTVPVTNNPFADAGYKFVRNPELPLSRDLFNLMATAPTPSSGGLSATLIGSGISTSLRK